MSENRVSAIESNYEGENASAHSRPRPQKPPVYQRASDKLSFTQDRDWGFDDVVDALFFIFSGVATLWLAYVFLAGSIKLKPTAIAWFLIFWAVTAYLALPRIHQLLTWLYVPDYFIGRTRTADGLLGDPVNLALVGSEIDIHAAMTAAGWVRADPITPRTVLRVIRAFVSRRSYDAAPVSNLVLFGRKQDFAYQKAVPGRSSERHHVRFWRTPDGWVLPGGRRVEWLAAGTFDRAVGLSLLTFQITHKIDADIDIERNFIVDDVLFANPAAELEILPDFFSAYHDKNGGGDRVITDGDLYLLDVQDVEPNDDDAHEMADAHDVDSQAHRQRPVQLVVGMVLVALMFATELFQTYLVLQNPWKYIALNVIGIDDVADAQIYILTMRLIVAFVTLILLVMEIITAVMTWNGHPRARIILLTALSADIIFGAADIASSGATHIVLMTLIRSSLGVLALLALSARACHQWVRERKKERLQAKAKAAGVLPTSPAS